MKFYKIYKNCITVSFDDSELVIKSDSELQLVFSNLLSDFCLYYLSLPVPVCQHYYYVYTMIEKIQVLSASLDHQVIVDMLRNLFVIVHRFNYPEFRIIFVNEV